jgi:hypothetical protein
MCTHHLLSLFGAAPANHLYHHCCCCCCAPQAFDKNGDGRLSIQELQEALLLGTCGGTSNTHPPLAPQQQQQQQQQAGPASDRDAVPSSTPDRGVPAGATTTAAGGAGGVASSCVDAPAGDSLSLVTTRSFQSVDPQEERKILEESIHILKSVAQDRDGYIGYDDFVVMMRAGSSTDQSRRKAALRRRGLQAASLTDLQPPMQQQHAGGSYKQQQQQEQVLPHVVRAAA